MLKDYLTQEVANWEFIGAPALLQRFVLRNGKSYTPTKRIGRRGIPKQCFDNAARAVLRKDRADWSYVEGFAIHRDTPIIAFHHAWVTTDGTNAMDPTLSDAAEYDYFGITFNRDTLLACGLSSVLDTGVGLNWKLMFMLDPDLKTIIDGIKPHERWQTAQDAWKHFEEERAK